MGKTIKNASKQSKFTSALDKLERMTTGEFRQTLNRLGISKPDGKLTVRYSTKK